MASLAVFASNISQTGKAALSYAKDNNSHFPEVKNKDSYNTYILRENNKFFNHGVLVEQEYSVASVLFCPQKNADSAIPPFVSSVYTNSNSRHDIIYSEQFNVEDGKIIERPGEKRARSGYSFILVKGRENMLLPQFDNTDIFVIDNIISKSRTAHKKYFKGWNVMKFDGGLKLVKSNEAYVRILDTDLTKWKTFKQLQPILTQ